MAPATATRIGTAAALLVWLGAVGFGLYRVVRYELTPGPARAAPEVWPADSALVRGQRATVVLFAHPLCPCTGATLSELAELMARGPGATDLHVLFCSPVGAGEDWSAADAWDAARAIPDARVRCDEGGVEARRFGAMTSGQVLVYDGAGVRVFRGGITRARGHRGPSIGRAAVEAAIRGEAREFRETPVFGCELPARSLAGTGDDS